MESKARLLTVELQDGVVHLALDLACALERAGHPQSLVHGDGRDDVVPDVSGHLPLGQNGANDQSN